MVMQVCSLNLKERKYVITVCHLCVMLLRYPFQRNSLALIQNHDSSGTINPLKPELNPICYLLALLGAHHFLHVSRIRVKLLTLR